MSEQEEFWAKGPDETYARIEWGIEAVNWALEESQATGAPAQISFHKVVELDERTLTRSVEFYNGHLLGLDGADSSDPHVVVADLRAGLYSLETEGEFVVHLSQEPLARVALRETVDLCTSASQYLHDHRAPLE